MSATSTHFAPLAASTGEPARLAMQRLWLGGRLLAAGARLTVQHVFRSNEKRPLEVIYSFPLPRDAALRAFRIAGDGFEAHSELKRTEEAVKAYEQGIEEGSLAALARQYGDGIVNLSVGNVRPGETVVVHLELLAGVEPRDDGFRFRFPFTLAPGYHRRARAAVVEGEGEMELPADEFGDVILPRWRKDARELHETGFELSVLHGLPAAAIGSPSHSIRVIPGERATTVALAPERDLPDRDLVLDVSFRESGPQVLAGSGANGKRCYAAVVPSTAFGRAEAAPRRAVILLDRSGSMAGAPIEQARRAIQACLGALAEEDSFGLAAFDDRVETMHPSLLPATRENRENAGAFLSAVDARGGTELAQGVAAAARMLGGAGDILILTDGEVMGTEDVLAKVRATGVRLHCLGIGSASQDRFLAQLARETGGVSRFVTARERVDLPAVDLFASMGRPVAASLRAGAGVEPEPPAAVFAGTPVTLFGEGDKIELEWDGGRLSLDVAEGDPATGETVRLLRGARLIADWESRYPSKEAAAPLEKRKGTRVANRLAALSEAYGLASREMSLVAVVSRAGDRPGELPETKVVPVGMPQDMDFEAYFRRSSSMILPAMPPDAGPAGALFSLASASLSEPLPKRRSAKRRFAAKVDAGGNGPDLFAIAAALEPDGGMPGATAEIRLARSLAALMAFAAAGHTASAGAFRAHVARLRGFVQSLALQGRQKDLAERALAASSGGPVAGGDWLGLALSAATGWQEIEAALGGA